MIKAGITGATGFAGAELALLYGTVPEVMWVKISLLYIETRHML